MALARTPFGICTLLSSLVLFGCSSSGNGSGAGEGATASAVFAITNAPGDAACLQASVDGSRAVSQQFPLIPGQNTTFTLQGLPVGSVVFSEQAFAESCTAVTPASIPTWLSDPLTTTLTAGVPAQVTIVLRRNGQATVTSDFDDDAGATSDADAGAGDAGPMCQYFFDDSTLPLLGPGGVRPPLP
jgi:hypothetical protein